MRFFFFFFFFFVVVVVAAAFTSSLSTSKTGSGVAHIAQRSPGLPIGNGVFLLFVFLFLFY